MRTNENKILFKNIPVRNQEFVLSTATRTLPKSKSSPLAVVQFSSQFLFFLKTVFKANFVCERDVLRNRSFNSLYGILVQLISQQK